MVSETVTFDCEQAFPMKAVAVLIQKASTYKCGIWIARGDRKANAKSLLGVMSLGIEGKTNLVVSADGPDEKEALKDICSYLKNPQL